MEPVLDILDPLDWLVAAAAGKRASWVRLVLTFDKRCGHAVQIASEPLIAQMRLAWWRDVLSGAQAGKGEPLVEALRVQSQFADAVPHLVRIVDGWEEWAVGGVEALPAYASGRGGGLFRAFGATEQGENAGALWALWDIGEQEPAALAIGKDRATLSVSGLSGAPKILALLARNGLRKGRGRPARFSRGLYLAVLKAQFLGR